MLARGCREMLAVSGDNSARCLAKQVVSERVQCLSPFRLERMMAGVCRTMKSKNNVPKLHGVGGGDLSASDCLSPSLLLVVMCREGGARQRDVVYVCLVRMRYTYL